jgi:hypothetical protein
VKHVDRASDLPVRWRVSSRSSQGANCVQVAVTPAFGVVRDSKNPDGPALVIPRRQLGLMFGSIKENRLD